MELMELTLPIYLFLGLFVVIAIAVGIYKAFASDVMTWLTHPNSMAGAGCLYMTAMHALPIIWCGVAFLCGFWFCAHGFTILISVCLALLIAVAYPVALFLVEAVVFVVGVLCVWIYYSILGEIRKAQLRRAKKAELKRKKQEKTE